MKSTIRVKHWLIILPAILTGVFSNPVMAQEDTYTAFAIFLNREDDCSPLANGAQLKCGVNLDVHANNNQGFNALEVGAGMLLASGANGTGQTLNGRPRGYAGQNQGGGTILTDARFPTLINGGAIILGGGSQWLPPPELGHDGFAFLDPTRGRPQPSPADPTSTRWGPGGPQPRAFADAIPGGADTSHPTLLPPGVYYSVETASDAAVVANGKPVRLGPGHFRFEPAVAETFGEFVIVGGLLAPGGAVHIQVGPGLYYFAGAQESSNKPGDLIRLSNNSTFSDDGPKQGPANNGGELLVFSDARSPRILELAAAAESQMDHNLTNLLAGTTGFAPLRQGIAGFQAPNNGHLAVNLHGLTDMAPEELAGVYRSFVIWQDRNNSIVDYADEDGGFPGGIFCGDFSPGCSNTGEARRDEFQNPIAPEAPGDRLNSSFPGGESTEFVFPSNPDVHIMGVSYQPRGGFLSVVGDGGAVARVQIISGAMRVQGNSSISIARIPN